MTDYEVGKLEAFDFGEFLFRLKMEMNISYSEIGRRAKMPSEAIYKYTCGERANPSLVDFIKILQFAGISFDEWYYNLMGMPNQMEELRHYVNNLTINEIMLIDRIQRVDEKIRDRLIKSIATFIEEAFINQ